MAKLLVVQQMKVDEIAMLDCQRSTYSITRQGLRMSILPN